MTYLGLMTATKYVDGYFIGTIGISQFTRPTASKPTDERGQHNNTEQNGGIRSSAIPAIPDDGTSQGRRIHNYITTQMCWRLNVTVSD